MLTDLWLRLHLLVLRAKRSGLRRERARYREEIAIYNRALNVNALDAAATERAIDRLDEDLRARRTARRFPLRGPDARA